MRKSLINATLYVRGQLYRFKVRTKNVQTALKRFNHKLQLLLHYLLYKSECNKKRPLSKFKSVLSQSLTQRLSNGFGNNTCESVSAAARPTPARRPHRIRDLVSPIRLSFRRRSERRLTTSHTVTEKSPTRFTWKPSIERGLLLGPTTCGATRTKGRPARCGQTTRKLCGRAPSSL